MLKPLGDRARSQAWYRSPITLGVGQEFDKEPIGWRTPAGDVADQLEPGTVEGNWHRGTDFALPDGYLVTVALAGNVTYAEWSPLGYGNLVTIEGARYKCRYAHLSQIYAVLGTWAIQGLPLGRVGHSGNATGPHLHFEVYDKQLGLYVDPYRTTPCILDPASGLGMH